MQRAASIPLARHTRTVLDFGGWPRVHHPANALFFLVFFFFSFP